MTTITISRATVEQALEALKDDQYRLVEVSPNQYEYKTDLAIAALERALAQQAEPVQRRPLSEEEIERICMTYQSPRQAARAIERAHGIGDNT